jgi:mannose-6-phosphate isomerase-like protein (cupin superfamily)
MPPEWATHRRSERVDVIAPDGSEIRLLGQIVGASMVHCSLPAGAVSLPVRHRTVEEVWYILSGRGQLWRSHGEQQQIVDLVPGLAVTIPLETSFQFSCTGDEPLTLAIVTSPPWPGADEAVAVDGPWSARTPQT